MATQYVYVLLLWLSSYQFTFSAPVASKDNMIYHEIKKDDLATSVPSDVYIKSVDSNIPQLFHAIELKKKGHVKRQVSNEKNIDSKAKQRTPLEKGLWGKRFAAQQSSITNKVPNDYTKRLLQKEVRNIRLQNRIANDKSSSISLLRSSLHLPEILVIPKSVKKSTEFNDAANGKYDFENNHVNNDIKSGSFGPIEKGLWGKRDEIDQDLDTVIYLENPNDVTDTKDMVLSRDTMNKLGNWKRYFMLRKLGNSDDNGKEKRINPVEKGLWGKRNALYLRENNALYNSKTTNDVSTYTRIGKDAENLNSKPSSKEDYGRIYVVRKY